MTDNKLDEDRIVIQEFVINELLTVKLENEMSSFSNNFFKHVNIYIKKVKISTIDLVFFNRPQEFPKDIDKIQSINDMENYFGHFRGTYQVSQEEIYWVVCSNLQVWVENNYNPNLLHYKLFFRLVKELSDVGDLKAREIFQNEIIKTLEKGSKIIITFLAGMGYFYFLPIEYTEKILEVLGFKQTNDFKKSNFNVNRRQLIKYKGNEIIALGVQGKGFSYGRFPISLEGLSSLKRLYLNSNLFYLPDSINKLQNLIELEIISKENNGLKYLTNSIRELRSLEILKISGGQIEKLPQNIGDLTNLRRLEISGLKSNCIPESSNKLNSLEILKIRESNLNSLPKEIGLLKKLKVLDLSFNKLNFIPESIGQLENLEILNLTSNNLELLPESIGKLYSLKKLYIGENKLREIPISLAFIRSLKLLYLSGNNLTHIPAEFKNKGITIVLLWNPLKFEMTREFNLHNKFLSSLLEHPTRSIAQSIDKNLIIEIVEIFEDSEFFEYMMKNPELTQKIFIPILKEIFSSENRKVFYEMCLKSLDTSQYYSIPNLLEIFIKGLNADELKEFKDKIEEGFLEILYKVLLIGESDFWYELGREKIMRIFTSEFIKNKIIQSINQKDLNTILEIIDIFLWDYLSKEDTIPIFKRENNVITFLISNASNISEYKYDIYYEEQFYYPKNLHPKCIYSISKALKIYLEHGEKKEIKFIIITGIYDILNKEFYTSLDKYVLYKFLDIFIETGFNNYQVYDDFKKYFERLANQIDDDKISNFLREKIVEALKIKNFFLIQSFFRMNLFKFLSDKDAILLLTETNLISFIIDELPYIEDSYFSFKDFNDLIKRETTIAKKISHILSKIMRREKIGEVESIIKLDLFDFIEEQEIRLLFKKSKNFSKVLLENN